MEVRAGSQGRNLDARWMQRGVMLTDVLSLLSHSTEDHLHRSSITHNRLALPTSVINQENPPQAYLKASLMEVFSHLGILLLR